MIEPEIFVFQLDEDGGGEEMDGEDDIATYEEWPLPNRDFHGQWEALVFDDEEDDDDDERFVRSDVEGATDARRAGRRGKTLPVKTRLTTYAGDALLFSRRRVDPNLVAWNRVVLLHGPPGTGKTTLCKALAQRLAIRHRGAYPHASLVEVNAHSLFSRWFSESGKLVTRLFEKIGDLCDDEACLVFVLVDEVESLAAAAGGGSGSEPSDAMRVVNALLTQIDALRLGPTSWCSRRPTSRSHRLGVRGPRGHRHVAAGLKALRDSARCGGESAPAGLVAADAPDEHLPGRSRRGRDERGGARGERLRRAQARVVRHAARGGGSRAKGSRRRGASCSSSPGPFHARGRPADLPGGHARGSGGGVRGPGALRKENLKPGAGAEGRRCL